MRRVFAVLVILAVLIQPGTPQARAAQSEFRAYWVDAFGEGIFTPDEVDTLVADTKAANMNALVVQVGRRGDCFCNNASMPRTQAGIAAYPYDPLQTLIEKAHAQGIEVHAWIITMAMWNSLTPPLNPNHAFNLHGPSKIGYDNWLGVRYDGAIRAGADYQFDPGHPDAADYIVSMYTSVARNYDIDGLNFDRVRYPDTSGAPSWGYNPVAVARFQAATGRSDRPAPTDAQWAQWRRDQVTNIVRRVYLDTYALKPHVAISADTITYGYGPATQGGWESTRTYREVLQDWRAWMEEGILDLNIPMNYKRHHFTTEPNNQRRMYDEWNEFAKDHQYSRHTTIGSAIYLNFIASSVIQVRKALEPSAAGNSGVGWVGYSYRSPDCLSVAPLCGTPPPEYSTVKARAELTRALTQPSEYDPITPPVFAEPATVPAMPWKVSPTTGHIRGTVRTPEGVPFDQILVQLYDAETDAFVISRLSDGKGWFGFVDVAPGRYKAVVSDLSRVVGRHVGAATVTAGGIATIVLTPFAKGREGQRPVAETTAGFDPMEEDLLPNGER